MVDHSLGEAALRRILERVRRIESDTRRGYPDIFTVEELALIREALEELLRIHTIH